MKVAGYICDHCSEGYDIPETDVRDEYLCPKCGKKMWYLSSYEVDDETGLTIGEMEFDTKKEEKSPAPFSSVKSNEVPIVTCPYCQSTDCKKISGLSKAGSVALWGIFALGKTTKQWHCNNCKSDF